MVHQNSILVISSKGNNQENVFSFRLQLPEDVDGMHNKGRIYPKFALYALRGIPNYLLVNIMFSFKIIYSLTPGWFPR